MTDIFLKLIAQLSVCGPSNEPSVDDHALWTATMRSIYRLNDPQAHSFLAAINLSGLPNESPSALLLRAHQHAKALLPKLLVQHRDAKEKAEKETNHNRFIQEQAVSDPFLGEETQLTRDAFAGRGAIEEEQAVKIDGWGNVRQ